ncbi:MAG: hypothetical protein ACFFEF_06490 [Candidatus Thorarchaeota archaeon]
MKGDLNLSPQVSSVSVYSSHSTLDLRVITGIIGTGPVSTTIITVNQDRMEAVSALILIFLI